MNRQIKILIPILSFLGLGYTTVKAQESIKLEQTINKPLNSANTGIETRKYHGIIYDAYGIPLPYANVSLIGHKIGVQTNLDGEFSIEVKKGEVLRISCIGFYEVILKLKNKTKLRVHLKEVITH